MLFPIDVQLGFQEEGKNTLDLLIFAMWISVEYPMSFEHGRNVLLTLPKDINAI